MIAVISAAATERLMLAETLKTLPLDFPAARVFDSAKLQTDAEGFRRRRTLTKMPLRVRMTETETLDLAERAVTELSGGERQRVHLAQALAQQTQIILLDEPTANRDLAHQFEALQLVRNFTRAGGVRSRLFTIWRWPPGFAIAC